VGSADFRLPHTGFSTPAGIPDAAVTAEDADLIVHLAAQGKVRLHLTLTPQKLADETSYNVIANLKGSEHPEQIVVVSGHLDSWDLGTGAIDDGAGVVVAMQAAEVLQRLHLRPARTLRVIAWMDEETGGSGSRAYTAEYSNDFPHCVAAIESDSGAAHPLGFDAKATTAAIESLRPVQNALLSIGASALQPSSYSPGADITAMSDAGVPTFRHPSGQPNLFQLPSHHRRHPRQSNSQRTPRKRRSHGRNGLCAHQYERSVAAISSGVGTAAPGCPGAKLRSGLRSGDTLPTTALYRNRSNSGTPFL